MAQHRTAHGTDCCKKYDKYDTDTDSRLRLTHGAEAEKITKK